MSEENDGPEIGIADSIVLNSEIMTSEKSGFAPFLEATRQASDRSRFMIYLILVAVVASFGVYRSGRTPGWNSKRIVFYETVPNCYKDGWEKSTDKVCADIYKNRSQLGIPLLKNYDPVFAKALTESYAKQHEEAIKARQEALTISVPILGAKFDINDLGLVSGAALAALMFMLYASMRREMLNLSIAKEKAKTSTDLRLLETTQVFSSGNYHRNSLSDAIITVLYILPFLILASIDWYDWARRINTIYLEGKTPFYIEYGIKWTLALVTGYGAYLCRMETSAINKALAALNTTASLWELREKQEHEAKESAAKK